MICDCIFTVFLKFHPNRFCFIWEPHELVCKSARAILHSFFGSTFYRFFKLFKKWNLVSRFFRFQSQNLCFGASGRFLTLWHVQKNTNFFTTLTIFYTFALILFISFSYEPSRQYGTSPFSKIAFKKSK